MNPDPSQTFTFTIGRHEYPDLKAWGTFRMEAYPSGDGATFEYAVMQLDFVHAGVVATGGGYASANEALAHAAKAMWDYANTGPNGQMQQLNLNEAVADLFKPLVNRADALLGPSLGRLDQRISQSRIAPIINRMPSLPLPLWFQVAILYLALIWVAHLVLG